MSNEEPEAVREIPRKPKNNTGRITHEVFRLSDEPFISPKFLGALPEDADFRRDIRAIHGDGRYLIKTKQGGRFKAEREVILAEEKPSFVSFEPETDETGETNYFDLLQTHQDTNLNALQVENLLLKERLGRIEKDLEGQKNVASQSQTETLLLVKEMQKQSLESQKQNELSFNKGLELAKMLMQTQSAAKPEKDAVTMISELMTLNRSVKEFSAELNPPEMTEGGGIIGGLANLMDSVGRNAPTLLSTLATVTSATSGMMKPSRPQNNTQNQPAQNQPAQNQPSESFAELAAKARKQKGEN